MRTNNPNILKARADNIIYTYHESRKIFIPGGSGKTIYDDNREELYQQLKGEIQMLVLCGIHQIIKRLYPTVDNDTLSGKLLRQNKDTLKNMVWILVERATIMDKLKMQTANKADENFRKAGGNVSECRYGNDR